MTKLMTPTATVVFIFFILIGPSHAGGSIDRSYNSPTDNQPVLGPYHAIEADVQQPHSEEARPGLAWKIPVWFGLWIIALYLWGTIPATRDEGQE